VRRESFGADGAFRAGPRSPREEGFDEEMKVQLDGARLVEVTERIDAYCLDRALALVPVWPKALYAVNNHVNFGAYRTGASGNAC